MLTLLPQLFIYFLVYPIYLHIRTNKNLKGVNSAIVALPFSNDQRDFPFFTPKITFSFILIPLVTPNLPIKGVSIEYGPCNTFSFLIRYSHIYLYKSNHLYHFTY